MPTAVDERCKRQTAADIQRTDPLGPIQLVGGQRQQVDAVLGDIDLDLPNRLSGIGMKQGAGGTGHAGQIADWLEHADFVVGRHHADQHRGRRERGRERIRVEQPVAPHGQIRDGDPLLLQPGARVQNRPMFGAYRDDVITPGAGRVHHTLQGQVV